VVADQFHVGLRAVGDPLLQLRLGVAVSVEDARLGLDARAPLVALSGLLGFERAGLAVAGEAVTVLERLAALVPRCKCVSVRDRDLGAFRDGVSGKELDGRLIGVKAAIGGVWAATGRTCSETRRNPWADGRSLTYG
jgi:hypothetical protein